MDNCLFCKIVAGEIPANIIYQDEDVVAFEDINPQAPLHILLIPRRHIGSMTDVTQEDGALLASIYMAATRIARERGVAESGFRFLTNVGPDSGQSVFHLHFHLLGGRKLGWPPG